MAATTQTVRPESTVRHPYADNLKTLLVAGVIVGHTTMAWTGIGNWVFKEPQVGEPVLSILSMMIIVAMFGMSLFFFIAGMFTPRSLARKGLRRFLVDRTIRLGLPMLLFIVAMSPIIEYVDPENASWDRGFWAFTRHIWWPPAPGPTWFLGVLLLFSAVYAVMRTIRPVSPTPRPLRARQLLIPMGVVVVASYVIRIVVPLGEERWRLALGQAPGWVAGFTLGVLAAERGWLPVKPGVARAARWAAWLTYAASALILGFMATDATYPEFAGGGAWQSLLVAACEGILVVTMPLWLLDVFRRRFDHQGLFAREMSRSAFAAFLVHQLVLVGLVLVSRGTGWPPELNFVAVSLLGVAISFGFGSMVRRLPGMSRVL
jgi:hypothetical protein